MASSAKQMTIAIALFSLLFAAGAGPIPASDVQSLELKCLNSQEFVNDNIVVEFYADGQRVKFTVQDEKGTHRLRQKRMSANNTLIFNKETLRKIHFQNSLRIIVKEYDLLRQQTLGDVTIQASQTNTKTLSSTQNGLDWEYELSWTTN